MFDTEHARAPRQAPAPAPLGPAAAAGALAIVAGAAAVRLWNIDAGLPYHVSQDEPVLMQRVVAMMKTGDFNPHFFDWPSLTFYLNLVVATLTFLVGSMRGAWSHLDQISVHDLYLGGRVMTALLGAATVGLTFAAARRWGTGVALLAAVVMAVVPNHVRESHYVLTDVPTAFFTTLTLLLALRAHERQTTRAIAWASLAAGLAASCKYNGSMALLMPLLVVWTSGGGPALVARRTALVVTVGAAAFLAGTPYAVLDLPAFLNDYARLAFNFARDRGGEPGWSIYVKHLSNALAWPALVAALAGVAMGAWRLVSGPERVRALVLVTFTVVYFVVMARSFQIYGRYLLPLFPPLSIFAATALVAAGTWLSRRPWPRRAGAWAAAVLVVGVLAEPAVRGITFGRQFGQPTTVDQAYAWIREHVPPDRPIGVEAGAMHLPPPYEMVMVRSLLHRSLEEYRAAGVVYLVAAAPEFQAAMTDPQRHRETFDAYRRLLGAAVEVAAFDPAPDRSGPSLRVFKLVQ